MKGDSDGYSFENENEDDKVSGDQTKSDSDSDLGRLAEKSVVEQDRSVGRRSYSVELGVSVSIPGIQAETPTLGVIYDSKNDKVGGRLCAPSIGLGGGSAGVRVGGLGIDNSELPEKYEVTSDFSAEAWAASYVGISGSLSGSLSGATGTEGLSSSAGLSVVMGIGGGVGASQRSCVTVNLTDVKDSGAESLNRGAEHVGRELFKLEREVTSWMTRTWSY